MFSTREVLGLLAQANRGQGIDEERLRRAIRTGAIPPPSTIAGRYVWSEGDLELLTKALGLRSPLPSGEKGDATRG
jgi:hypothetical protein